MVEQTLTVLVIMEITKGLLIPEFVKYDVP